jgi:hypothetical protein
MTAQAVQEKAVKPLLQMGPAGMFMVLAHFHVRVPWHLLSILCS